MNIGFFAEPTSLAGSAFSSYQDNQKANCYQPTSHPTVQDVVRQLFHPLSFKTESRYSSYSQPLSRKRFLPLLVPNKESVSYQLKEVTQACRQCAADQEPFLKKVRFETDESPHLMCSRCIYQGIDDLDKKFQELKRGLYYYSLFAPISFKESNFGNLLLKLQVDLDQHIRLISKKIKPFVLKEINYSILNTEDQCRLKAIYEELNRHVTEISEVADLLQEVFTHFK